MKAFQQPNANAVVIGIRQYREDVSPKVSYAVQGELAIAAVLETQGGIPKTHIKLLTDAKATVGDFRSYFGDWLRMRVKPDSTIYVYYAGHGTPNPKTGEAFLVPWEGHPDFPSGLYPLNELYETLNGLPAKEIVVMLDSCFSGSEGRSVLAKGARPMAVSVENPLLAGGKVIVLAAATGNQISSDYDKAGHGLFTYALLTGLRGDADADKDAIVTLKEVFPYVRDWVAHTAVEELNREQTPVLLPGEETLGVRSSLPVAWVYGALHQTRREITGKDGTPMLLIPKGEFLMGSNDADDDQKPAHKVYLDAFYIDKYEVTTSRYAKFLETTGSAPPPYWEEAMRVENRERPVIGVDWSNAATYCRWAGKRLPTEAEWEKAARGTDGRIYPWGSELPTRLHANFGKRDWEYPPIYTMLVQVGQLEDGKSPYGVYDMAGNVWEWVADWYDWSIGSEPSGYYRISPERNPTGPSTGTLKVLRGGSWSHSPRLLHSAHRGANLPSTRYAYIGFRCATAAPK